LKEKNRVIRKDEAQFSIRLLSNLIVPTFVLDAEGKVLIWNKACEQLTAVKAEELIGTRDHWKAFYDEPRDCLADLMIKGKTEEINALYDVRVDQEDCSMHVSIETWCEVPHIPGQFYLAADAAPIYGDTGEVVAVVETLRDLTVQRLAQDELEQLAEKDALTNLANRGTFDKKLQEIWDVSQRSQSLVSLLFIDIDHFKQFNDIYGHQAGDDCLKVVANCIAEQSQRDSDFSARYGGEEFVVILLNCDLQATKLVAERICNAVQHLGYAHSGSSTADCVTISIGTNCLTPTQGESIDNFIEQADKALYKAKEAGRNRVFGCTS